MSSPMTCHMCHYISLCCAAQLGNAGLLNRTGAALQSLAAWVISPFSRKPTTNVREGGFGNGNNALFVAFNRINSPIHVTVCETPLRHEESTQYTRSSDSSDLRTLLLCSADVVPDQCDGPPLGGFPSLHKHLCCVRTCVTVPPLMWSPSLTASFDVVPLTDCLL